LNLSDEFREEFPCLKKFKFQKNNVRIFAKSLEELSAEKKEKLDNPNMNKPLFNMNFSTHGKLTRKNDEIKAMLGRLGGKLVTSINNLTVALITNEGEFQN
jgi:NAD-dependent DNA ligase